MRTVGEIKSEIKEQLGFVPPFFEVAQDPPELFEHFWRHTRYAYLENPLPVLFKERLLAYLSRFCSVDYCVVCHSCALRPLGMSASQILKLLTSPAPNEAVINGHLQSLKDRDTRLKDWPETETVLEAAVFSCCVFIFLKPQLARSCQSELQRLLEANLYNHLTAFLAYVKSYHLWAEANPDLSYETDQRVQNHLTALVQEVPELGNFFQTYSKRVAEELQRHEVQQATAQARQQAEANLRFLSEASEILTSSLDYKLTLVNLAHLTVSSLADWCTIDVVEEDGKIRRVVAVHSDPAKADLTTKLLDYPPDLSLNSQVAQVFRTRQSFRSSYSLNTEAELKAVSRDEAHFQILQQLGLNSLMIVPLQTRGQFFGVISLMTADSERHYEEADLELTEELARRAASAIDNARLYQETQRAFLRENRRVRQLYRLTRAALAIDPALPLPQLLQVITLQAHKLIGAHQAVISIVKNSDWEHSITAFSVSDSYTNQRNYQARLNGSGIYGLVCRTNKPLRLSQPELEARPEWQTRPADPLPLRGLLAAPLIGRDGQNMGLIYLSDKYEGQFSSEDETMLVQLAQMASVAISNVELYEAERKARAEVETAKQRLSFLVEASSELVSSLDMGVILQNLASLTLPQLADFCVIDLLGEDQVLRRVAVAHVNPVLEAELREICQRYPVEPDIPEGIAQILRSGQPRFSPNLDDVSLTARTRSLDELTAVRKFSPQSFIGVPLTTHGRTLGVVSLVFAESGRQHNQSDLELAAELARRAALVIDNARLYQEAQDVIEAQKELDRLRDQFLSTASHELRTPLTSIKGFAQILQRNLIKMQRYIPREGEIRPALNLEREMRLSSNIVHQSNRLISLIAELLDISQVSSGQLELVYTPNVNIVELVRQVVLEQQDITANHVLIFEADQAEISGRVDETRIEQVITNLISNAIKYSEVGKPVIIGVKYKAGRADAKLGAEAVIWVKDEGWGINPEQQERIFEQFYRIRAADDPKTEGLGLGLYISQEIVVRHGGRLWVESKPGEGSTFYFSLPLD